MVISAFLQVGFAATTDLDQAVQQRRFTLLNDVNQPEFCLTPNSSLHRFAATKIVRDGCAARQFFYEARYQESQGFRPADLIAAAFSGSRQSATQKSEEATKDLLARNCDRDLPQRRYLDPDTETISTERANA